MPVHSLALHGGAGLIGRHTLSPEREARCRAALQEALHIGDRILAGGGEALDAVTEMVCSLENTPLFNAGRGAVLTRDETVEHDAAVAVGSGRQIGALCAVKRIEHPILGARAILEHSEHVLIAGAEAERFCEAHGLTMVPNTSFITTERLEQVRRSETTQLDHDDVYGTVGAVARDRSGGLAAATSTGGMVRQHPGRVGDCPIPGAGTLAHEGRVAISGTGHGEIFLRHHVAARIADWMEIGGLSLQAAARRVVRDELPEGSGGVIAIDHEGNVATPFNTGGMFRATRNADGIQSVDIW